MSEIPVPPFFNGPNCACEAGIMVFSHYTAERQMVWKCGVCKQTRTAPNTLRNTVDEKYTAYLRGSDIME